MITGNIRDAKRYFCVNDKFEKAFEILDGLDLSSNERITVEEGVFWINIAEFEEAPSGEKLFETHEKFLDLHFVISGEKKFGYANAETLSERIPFDVEKDIMYLEGKADVITLKKGDFCLVFPEDAHIPVLGKGEGLLKKAIVKIRF